MGKYLSENDVKKIAEYTRISLSDTEKKSLTTVLNDIVESLQIIRSYDLKGVKPTFNPIGGLSNVMREDVEAQGFSVDEALNNAPAKQDNCFVIPSILGNDA
ncbi:MAG: Asp-tRNA(Asn)/Glu-tRNA(Gln) amidotransferase subunit GatC [Eggerthellaceae bacterium]|nr:Asp-tRNA(Asn)/Glu-tRNA(Gln) amidotransferase subunit GatC [Eggerthellaceae bacterium]